MVVYHNYDMQLRPCFSNSTFGGSTSFRLKLGIGPNVLVVNIVSCVVLIVIEY